MLRFGECRSKRAACRPRRSDAGSRHASSASCAPPRGAAWSVRPAPRSAARDSCARDGPPRARRDSRAPKAAPARAARRRTARRGRARAPARGLVAHIEPLRREIETLGMHRHARLEIEMRLALQPVEQPARRVLLLARHIEARQSAACRRARLRARRERPSHPRRPRSTPRPACAPSPRSAAHAR